MAARAEYGVNSGSATQPRTFDELYQQAWWPLVRLAIGLVDDRGVAEDVVQDAFAGLYRRWDSIREPAAAIGYLRTSVVNNSRSVLRRRGTARKHLRVIVEETDDAADHSSLLGAEHEMVRAALTELPDRQREVLTLRYIADLSDQAIAEATGLSPGGVRSASSRGLAALRNSLGGRL
jgi:RNA polymerase sigma-70 factor (sigma-E family)